MSDVPDHPATLDAVLDDAWHLLVRGVDDRNHGFHLAVLATNDADGGADARTVVLRAADRATRTIACHTDARSPKVAQLQARPRALWVLYDPGARVQIRLTGTTRVTDVSHCPLARDAWERTSPNGRRCYLAPRPPSRPRMEPEVNLPQEFLRRAPTMEESEEGVMNFRRVTTTIERLEWLRLRHDGHRRAAFAWPESGVMTATWLDP